LELKARLDLPTLSPTGLPGESGGTPRAEVRAALVELGYGPEEIRGVLDRVDDDGPVEEMVRSALRELARSR
jgi:Holliday junction resolvasome RuvABC DNA-binding subunit